MVYLALGLDGSWMELGEDTLRIVFPFTLFSLAVRELKVTLEKMQSWTEICEGRGRGRHGPCSQ